MRYDASDIRDPLQRAIAEDRADALETKERFEIEEQVKAADAQARELKALLVARDDAEYQHGMTALHNLGLAVNHMQSVMKGDLSGNPYMSRQGNPYMNRMTQPGGRR